MRLWGLKFERVLAIPYRGPFSATSNAGLAHSPPRTPSPEGCGPAAPLPRRGCGPAASLPRRGCGAAARRPPFPRRGLGSQHRKNPQQTKHILQDSYPKNPNTRTNRWLKQRNETQKHNHNANKKTQTPVKSNRNSCFPVDHGAEQISNSLEMLPPRGPKFPMHWKFRPPGGLTFQCIGNFARIHDP